MKTVAALFAAVALQSLVTLPSTIGYVLASDFESVRLQATTNTTAPPATTTTAPPAPPVTTTAAPTTTPAPSDSTTTPAPSDTTPASSDATPDDELIQPLRDGEVLTPVSAVSLLASTATSSAVAPWWFTTGGKNLLAADYTTSTTTTSYPCTSADNLPYQGTFDVLVAVSSCFDRISFNYIQAWIDSLGGQDARYFQGDNASKVNFDIRMVDDGCNRPSWATKELKADDRKQYVATISIMVYTKGCGTIQKFTALNQIGTTIGYVYNGPTREKGGTSSNMIQTSLPGYTPATWVDEANGFLSRFNPFGTARKIHCSSLPNGVPTSYVEGGKRKCFCSCPVGFELRNNACVSTTTPYDPVTGDENCACAWSTKADGYKIAVSAYSQSGVCSIKNQALRGTTGLLPVPVVVDNYVDHYRTNAGDSGALVSTPRIELLNQRLNITVQTQGSPDTVETVTLTAPSVFTWKSFQNGPDTLIDKLDFSRVGRYKVQLRATDYGTEDATCEACVLVVDAYRPTENPSSACPKPVDCNELTTTNIKAIQNVANGIVAFKNNALNDPCSPNKRCDVDSLQTKQFVDADYTAPDATLGRASSFFETNTVINDLKAMLNGSPFDATTANGIAASVQPSCTRCMKASTTLKEWWVDYKCSSDQAPAKCDGTTACSFTQCVTVKAEMIASTAAVIKDGLANASLAVVKAIAGNDKKTDTALRTEFALGTSVHVALQCTQFPASNAPADPNCQYKSKVTDLIDTSTTLAVKADALLAQVNIAQYVYWRYRVDAGAWREWSTSVPMETFSKSETAITIEAWSKCGQIKSYSFKVILHLNNKIQVCDKFNDMWYQDTRETPKLPVNLDLLCMHPKSDFAEVTFDYHPNIGLTNTAFEMTINKVQCMLWYDNSKSNATIIDVTGTSSYQIVKEFSIDGANVGSTKAETNVFVSCKFVYKRTLDATTDTQVCNRKFVIKDCTPPKITKPCPSDGKCDYNKCSAATDVRRDLYQACGGNRVSQDNSLNTLLTTTEGQCCPSCDTKYFVTKCKSIRSTTPTSLTTDSLLIKRCEPEAVTTTTTMTGNYGYDRTSLLEAAVEDLQAQPQATMALVGATALVAVVALVVVRRRQRETTMIEEDAYYPLMG